MTEAQHAGDGETLGAPWPPGADSAASPLASASAFAPPASAGLDEVILRRRRESSGARRVRDPRPVDPAAVIFDLERQVSIAAPRAQRDLRLERLTGGHALFLTYERPAHVRRIFTDVRARRGWLDAMRSLRWLVPTALFDLFVDNLRRHLAGEPVRNVVAAALYR